MPPFRWYAPSCLADCLQFLDANQDANAKLIAGGQSLMPLLALRLATPDILVDLSQVTELDRVLQDEDSVYIGALTRHATLVSDRALHGIAPILSMAAQHIGHVAIRNRGTIGGSLSHADAAAELPAVSVLLDATLICLSDGAAAAEIPARSFFLGPYMTVLTENQLLAWVRVPKPPTGTAFGFVEFAHRVGDYARAGAACSIHVDPDGNLLGAKGVVFAVSGSPVDVTQSGQLPIGTPVTDIDWRELAHGWLADLDRVSRRDLAAVALHRGFVSAVNVASSRRVSKVGLTT